MVRIGLIGLGHLGNIHLRLLQEIASMQIVGVYDTNTTLAQQVASEHQLRAFTSYTQMLKEVDAIDIVTPTISHYHYAAKAIKHHKNVFIEKPVSNTLREARELLKLEQEANNVKVQVGHVERFNPAYLAIKNKSLKPRFIEAHRLAMFNPRGTDVSVVLDLMIHDLDIILKTVNSTIKRIQANGVAIISPSPDIANARIEFTNGCVANVTASRLSVKNMRKIRFFQNDAYVSLDFLDKKTEVVRLTEQALHPMSMPLELADGKKKYLEFDIPEVPAVNAIKMELELFGQAILHNTEIEVSLQDGVNALELATQIMEKLHKNTIVSGD